MNSGETVQKLQKQRQCADSEVLKNQLSGRSRSGKKDTAKSIIRTIRGILFIKQPVRRCLSLSGKFFIQQPAAFAPITVPAAEHVDVAAEVFNISVFYPR